jgi:signal peptidase
MVLVVLGLVFNVSIMMFRTGSMEPTIKTGSIALVREIPAVEIAEGDVVTVDRGEDLLPVTHRVTEIQHVDESTGDVTFVMRGDANDTDDPEPYTADTVRRAFFSIPGIAPVIQWFQNPYVLGGLTLGASVLVVWAFWPRDDEAVETEQTPSSGSKHRAQSVALPSIVLLAIPILSAGQVTSTDIYGDYLRLRSSGDVEQMTNMAPGDSATWAVDVWAEAPEPGMIDLSLSTNGQLATAPDALKTEVTICAPHPEVLTSCALESSSRTEQIDTAALAATQDQLPVATMHSDETRRVVVRVSLTNTVPEAAQDATATFRLTATGVGEELSATSDSDLPSPSIEPAESGLPSTGFGSLFWLLLGFSVLTLGVIVFKLARMRKQTVVNTESHL